MMLGAVAALPASVAEAGPLPAPTRIEIVSVTSLPVRVAPPETPELAVPNLLVQTGDTLEVTVHLYDGALDAAFNKDTPLRLTTNRGTLSGVVAVAPADLSTAVLTATITGVVNQVVVTVDDTATGKKASDILPDSWDDPDDEIFDVVSEVRSVTSRTGLQQGIGGQDDCTIATKQKPVCGIVELPNGARSPNVVLSTGACDANDAAQPYAPCVDQSGTVVQVLADLGEGDQALYDVDSPATLVMKCDKALCGGGSIQNRTLYYSLAGNALLEPIAACPAKGTLAVAGTPCLDYVQSKRDGSGDSYYYFLFDRDARVSVG